MINECYADVLITGGVTSRVGGLIGVNTGKIANSYSIGSVTVGSGGYGGGLIGYNECFSGTCGSDSESYSTGLLTGATDATVGGLIGADTTSGEIADTYWDTSTSGITNLSQGAGNVPNDPGVAGLSTAQLQASLPPGFDPSVWAEDPNINGGLPYLLANPPL